MIENLMEAAKNFLETIQPEDALELLAIVGEDNCISSKCREVNNYILNLSCVSKKHSEICHYVIIICKYNYIY